jgi:hypothetical protein
VEVLVGMVIVTPVASKVPTAFAEEAMMEGTPAVKAR